MIAAGRRLRRQTPERLSVCTAWLGAHVEAHPDAFADAVGAEAAVTVWRRHLLRGGAGPSSVNQGLAAVTLLYEHGAGLRIKVKRARRPRPGQPDALTPAQQGAVERDAAIIAVLLCTGARVEECARLNLDDITVTARTGHAHLIGKGVQVRDIPLPPQAREKVSVWLARRGNHPGPLWTGQRGPLSISGIAQVVLAVGEDAKLPGLRPHRLRHATLRQGSPQGRNHCFSALIEHST